jgi:hypothetical protein
MAKREPRSEVHRKQRTKNFAVFAALLGLIVLIYLITIVRIGGA